MKPGIRFLFWPLGGAAVLALGGWVAMRGQTAPRPDAAQSLIASLPVTAGSAASEKAIVRCAAELRKKPDSAATWVELGDAFMQRARETGDTAVYAHAETTYRQALELRPKDAAAATGLAWVFGSRHEFEQSIVWAKRAIDLDPKNDNAYGILGDAEVEMGSYDAALQHYQKMLDLRPNLASYSRAGHLVFLMGDYRKGMWLMMKAIEAGSPYSENTQWCRAQLAGMLWNTGAYRPAEQLLTHSLKTAPKNPHLLLAMGRVKSALRDYPAAMDYYRQAVEIAPQHEALVGLGDLLARAGRKEEAERQFAMVEAMHQLNRSRGVAGDLQIAQFYANHDRKLPDALRQAEAEYRTRKSITAADALAWCYYKNGRIEEARDTIREALKHRTPDAGILFHAGMIHAKLADRRQAQKYLNQALSLNPGFSPVFAPVAADTIRELGSTSPQASSGPKVSLAR